MSDGELDPPVGEHYFTERPRSRSARRELRFLYRGELLAFTVDAGVFASHGLDPGTSLLIEHLAVEDGARILDLGCGWGAVGVAAAKSSPHGTVILTDVNRRAARLAAENLGRNGIRNAEVRVGRLFDPVAGERFDLIATNPPFRAGRETVLEMLQAVPERLAPGGRLLLVGKGSQGIRFYQEWIRTHWGPGVAVTGRGSGYRVLDVAVPSRSGRAASEAVKKPTLLNGLPPRGRARPRASAPVHARRSERPPTGE
ncbi:MAG TPA: methyltransferase [Thermoplasmata archaeon]|nr:methyltransferase [Thermoplasmata archaeon]